jgi:hypothetical protein
VRGKETVDLPHNPPWVIVKDRIEKKLIVAARPNALPLIRQVHTDLTLPVQIEKPCDILWRWRSILHLHKIDKMRGADRTVMHMNEILWLRYKPRE